MSQEISKEIKSLSKSLPKREAFNASYAEKLFNEKKYELLISAIKKHMGVNCHLKIRPASEYKKTDKLMSVNSPVDFPLFGTKEYLNLSISIYYRPDALNNFYIFVLSIAHELAHIVLFGINHELRESERATDITAMMLGFSKFYEIGHTSIDDIKIKRTGYLNFEELIDVLNIIDP